MSQGIDRTRLKVTSREQIARLRAQRAREREWREVRKIARLYRRVRLATILVGATATLVVGLLRALEILPPLYP
jgi:hypothetical protein